VRPDEKLSFRSVLAVRIRPLFFESIYISVPKPQLRIISPYLHAALREREIESTRFTFYKFEYEIA
jgi:hypothetical protein